MLFVSRRRCAVGGIASNAGSGADYRSSTKIADAFHPLLSRTTPTFDHVVIDVSALINSVTYLTRDLVGQDRDAETVKHAQRQLQSVLLRRVQPRKSLSLHFDGSPPLWLIEQLRLFPGRRYDSKFYGSCASPMPYLLEEKIRGSAMELRAPPAETLLSSPATPGLAEGKMGAYVLDLATRLLRAPTAPPHLCEKVTPQDSICLIGAPDLAWLAAGLTPFENITVATLQHGELRGCTVREMMAWLRLGHLMPSTDGADTVQADPLMHRRLAAVRNDVVFLHLLSAGHYSAGLPQVTSMEFADLLDAYTELETAFSIAVAAEASSSTEVTEDGTTVKRSRPKPFRSFFFDEDAIIAAGGAVAQPSLRLRLGNFHKLLVAVHRSTAEPHMVLPAASTKPVPHAAMMLEMALQTHGLLCHGGVHAPDWTPTPKSSSATSSTGTALLDKYPKLSMDQLLQHIGFLITTAARTGAEASLSPQRSRGFALTGAETLLLTSTQTDTIQQILPLYARGHALAEAVAEGVVQTRSIHEALRKTRRILAGAQAQAAEKSAALVDSTETELAVPHPALTHLPSHLHVRTSGASGPPAGWCYYGVHLGVKAEKMNGRYRVNMGEMETAHLVEGSATADA